MDYKIPLNNIKDGKNCYKFTINKEFFKGFTNSDIVDGELIAEVDLIKNYRGIESEIFIDGKVKIPCDRCLEEYFEHIVYKGKLFFEFGDKTEEITDELIRLSNAEEYLDLSTYFSEFINLSLPFQKFHPTDKKGNTLCNPKMLEKIDELTNKKNKNTIDPRWEKLEKLKNKK